MSKTARSDSRVCQYSRHFVEGTTAHLHWVDVALENKGAVAIWNYGIAVCAVLHGDPETEVAVTRFVGAKPAGGSRECVVDVAETPYEHALLEVPR